MTPRLVAALAAVVVAGAGVGAGALVTSTSPNVTINPTTEAGDGGTVPATIASQLPPGATGCGTERAAVKHLTDGFVLPLGPTIATVTELVNMAAPIVGSSSPRLPQEQQLILLQGVHVIAAKQEADSDLHVIITTPTGAEMNVESPAAVCDSGSPYAAQLAQARAALDAALGHVSSSSYTPENLTANLTGVLFFDVLHGQRGAPNGIELHPVLCFSTTGGCISATPPPPATTTGTTTTTTGATTTPSGDDSTDELPGCAQYPGRIYFNHVKQNHCAANFYTSP